MTIPDVPLQQMSPLYRSLYDRFLLKTVQTLLASHPDAKRLRDEWAHQLSMLYRDVLREVAVDGMDPEKVLATMRDIQEVWETYFPDAKNPPKS